MRGTRAAGVMVRRADGRLTVTSWSARLSAAVFLGWALPVLVAVAALAELIARGAGPVVATTLVALLGYRIARQRCVLAGGYVTCANILWTRRCEASSVRAVRVADPPSLKVFGHGFRSKAWLCLECENGARLFPSALIRRNDRTDQKVLAAALGLPLIVEDVSGNW